MIERIDLSHRYMRVPFKQHLYAQLEALSRRELSLIARAPIPAELEAVRLMGAARVKTMMRNRRRGL